MHSRLAARAAWASYLSNAVLIDAFCEAVDMPDEDSGIGRRLDILSREIRLRERAGTLTDDDWRIPESRAVGR